MLATFFTPQLIVDGAVSGLVYGILAMGIVLVYRATRVINFAVGNMGMVGAGLLALLAVQYGVPYWTALIVGLLLGTLYGAIIELTVIRRLFKAPRVILLVATIGIGQLSLAILSAYPTIDVRGATFPLATASTWNIGDVRITGAQQMIIIAVPLVAGSLGWFLTRTTLGRTVAASVDNPDLARLSGINPKLVSTFAWAIAGFLSTLSLTLIAGQARSVQSLDSLGSSTLVRALAVAVIAGMASFPRCLTAGLAIGVLQSVIQFNFVDQSGLIDMLLFVGIVIAVYFQSRNSGAEAGNLSFAPKQRPIPERLRSLWWVRQLDRSGLLLLGVGAVILPLVVTQASRVLLYTTILGFAVCALSLTVLTGWAGQLSLGQMAFAGLGALITAGLTRGIAMNIGWQSTRIINAKLNPLPLGPSLVIAALITAAIAAVIGAGALRVRGLLLAVSTFAFAVACSQYIYRRPLLSGGSTGSVSFPRRELFGIDLTSQRSYYYMVLAVLAVVVVVIAHLRRTGIGRTTIAVRDNPDTAAAYTVAPGRTKLRAFALSGGIAGLGGALLAGAFQSVPNDRLFTVEDSLMLVAIVVIGGMGSVSGAVLGSLFVVGLPAFFPDSPIVPLLTSSLGLLILLMYFPGGLVQVAYAARDAILDLVARRHPEGSKTAVTVPAAVARRQSLPGPSVERPVVAENIVVRFGGIAAVDGASINVAASEIVGLIGTNGAGKSTLMNAISGFTSADGKVLIEGHDASALGAHQRARLGLGRTFQAATLFPELTVRDTVLVALEARGKTGLLSSALYLPHALRRERTKSADASELIDFLGLGRYADSYTSDLSTGTRRIVELAGLLALEARVLCLDEPTAGVAQRETEAFGPLIVEIRRELGACMLVIEHDMPLIMGISDRVYCLESGRVIAEGPPSTVRNDPAVIASYLGTDARAIARSGTAAPAVVNAAN